MNNQTLLIGIIFLFIGMFLIVLSSISSSENAKVAVGGFIGPIPFGFANDKRLMWALLGLMLLVLVYFLLRNR